MANDWHKYVIGGLVGLGFGLLEAFRCEVKATRTAVEVANNMMATQVADYIAWHQAMREMDEAAVCEDCCNPVEDCICRKDDLPDTHPGKVELQENTIELSKQRSWFLSYGETIREMGDLELIRENGYVMFRDASGSTAEGPWLEEYVEIDPVWGVVHVIA